jgi:glycosyltransferase involved in cell wall biosynthesis
MIIGIDASRYNLPNPTGVENYTNKIIEAVLLDDWGASQLLFYTRTKDQKRKLEDKIKNPNAQVKCLQWTYFWTLLGLSLELKKHPIDILFIPSHTTPLYTPKKIFATVHGIEALLHPEAYTWLQKTNQVSGISRMILQKTHMIAVSQSIKDDLIKYTEVDPNLITVIHNGFTPPAKMTDLETVKNKYHLPDKYILSIGRIEPRKNQLSLIKAFEDIAIQEKDLHLVLAGKPGTDGADIIRRAKSSRFTNRINILDYVPQDDLNTILNNAHIFAYPSLAEGFGIPILEAMSLGIPVLTSDGSACKEVAGNAAVLVDPQSIESIKEGLKKMLQDEELLHKLSLKGQEQAKLFSWSKCVEETIATIKQATNFPSSSPNQ